MTFNQFIQADELITQEDLSKDEIIVVEGDFHNGLIGLLSARISQKYNKASVVISKDGKGSARSIPNSTFSIVEAIKDCSKFLQKFGGHQGAAGLTIDKERVSDFRDSIQNSIKKQTFAVGSHHYDSVISIRQFPSTLIDELKILEPCGMGNPQPIFLSPFTFIRDVDVFGKYDKHLKMYIEQYRAFSFMKGDLLPVLRENKFLNLLYSTSARNELIVHELLTKIPS